MSSPEVSFFWDVNPVDGHKEVAKRNLRALGLGTRDQNLERQMVWL